MELTTFEDWARLLEFAEADDSLAQYQVASHYDFGLVVNAIEIVEENKSLAFEWYFKAYENGNIDAITRLADFLSEGVYCNQNMELAINLYQRGIENGNGVAANNLATVYRDKRDYEKAFELYKLAHDMDSSSSLRLALCYYFGIGTEKNVEMAFELFNRISNGAKDSQYDIDEANYFLAKIYLDGEIVVKSVTRARAFLLLANTDDDHRSAQNLLLMIGRND